jgi:hypothetical protein
MAGSRKKFTDGRRPDRRQRLSEEARKLKKRENI